MSKPYKDYGYSEYFQRDIYPKKSPSLSSFDTDSVIEEMSGDRIEGGEIYSRDRNILLSLEKGTLVITDRFVNLFEVDKDTKQIIIRDKNGNILLNTG